MDSRGVIMILDGLKDLWISLGGSRDYDQAGTSHYSKRGPLDHGDASLLKRRLS